MLIDDKIALFDFCETIADFQTADRYVEFVQQNSNPTHRGVRLLYKVLNKARVFRVLHNFFPKASISKRVVLLQLKDRSKDELVRYAKLYYDTVIKRHLIKPVVSELIRLQREGYKCVVVSGGYDLYLEYFCREYHIEMLICTKIKFSKNVCKGTFDGEDCMFDNKVRLVNSQIIGNQNNWYAFSDSQSDLPMLEIVGTPIVISRNTPQAWAKKMDYKQIIW